MLRRLAPAALLAALVAAGAAPAGAAEPQPPLVGLADQHARALAEPLVLELGVRHARLNAPWDGMRYAYKRREWDEWMRVAKATGVTPLVTFAPEVRKRGRLPTLAEYKRLTRQFRLRYPQVKEYSPWNEPNIASVPALRDPRKIAAFYRALRSGCPSCTVLGADLVDSSSMDDWLREYLVALNGLKPKVWGLHNYVDAHTRSSWGTRTLLRMTSGEVWFTETGGIYRRRGTGKHLPRGDRRRLMRVGPALAEGATRRVFTLAGLSPRIRRVYVYHWRDDPKGGWDSALVNARGTPRPSFEIFAEAVRRGAAAEEAARRPAPPVATVPPDRPAPGVPYPTPAQ